MSVTNHYPLISWTSDLTGTVSVRGDTGTSSAVSLGGSGRLGWEPSAVGGVTSAFDVLESKINSVSGSSGVTVTGVVYHVEPFVAYSGSASFVGSFASPFPRVELQITDAAVTGAPPQLIFDSAATAKQFGFSTATVTGAPNGASLVTTDEWFFDTDVTIPTVLSFGVVGRRWDPDVGYKASRIRSPFDASSQTTVQHAARRAYAIEWLNASARYIDAERAGMTLYADDAGTDATDTDATLEAMLDADQDDDVDFYLWLDGSTQRKVSLLWDSDPTTQTFVSVGSLGNRRFNISLPLIEV